MVTQPTDIDVPLPPSLRPFGEHGQARVSGSRDKPLVVVLGGISADRFVADGEAGWWPGLVGPGRAIDPARHRVMGIDFIADEAGESAPSTAEQAELLAAALDAAETPSASFVGASYGGMAALALAEARPERVERLAIISAPAAPHPAATAIRELQRRIVALGQASGRGGDALEIARGLAMLSYRTTAEFAERFVGGIPDAGPLSVSQPGAYLRARGEAYRKVMSPGRFLSLSASIDRHRVDPAAIPAPALLIGATSDQIVPPEQMRALAEAMPDARLHLLDCLHGHDMFLKRAEEIGALVRPFLEETR